MSFISSAWGNYGKINVWERSNLGNRILKTYDPKYYFYVPDENGKYTGVDGVKLSKETFSNKNDFEMGLRTHQTRYESDFSVLERVMMDNYSTKEPPILNIGFIDIEVDYNPEIGFSSVANSYAPISAITIYRSKQKDYITLVVPPKNWNEDDLSSGNNVIIEKFKNIIICDNEKDLLDIFLEVIEDIDLISGWNSEFFDLPYIAKRIIKVLGPSALKKLNFDGANREPQWKEVEQFGVKNEILLLEGRVHLDYLLLFKKFTLGGRASYSLAAIADDELEIPKIKYDGSLSDLYNNDFIKFIEYNIRDVEIIVKLDEKFKFINLANTMVHEATVNFGAVLKSVNLIDTAITNYAHNKLNQIVFDKKHTPGEHVEGAIVMTPKLGFWKWVFACDLVSLYPTVMRSLNLSIEKIRGQFSRNELDWKAIQEKSEELISMRLEENDEYLETSGLEWYEILKQKQWCVSAFGTVLDQSTGEGIVPAAITYWFNGRKELQAKKKEWAKKAEEIFKSCKSKENKEYIEALAQSEYFDMLQGVRKVLLNSTYGATLNEFSRFHDARLGASTTATGRQITTFMIENIGDLITGNKTKIVKTPMQDKNGEIKNEYTYEGNEITYGDTDSCYACIDGKVDNKNDACVMADKIVDSVNNIFPNFMHNSFLCQDKFKSLIKANREVVAETTIFQAKKKYMLNIVNLEGKDLTREDKKSFKTMGSDIKMSSIPVAIQNFLKAVTLKVLYNEDKKEIEDFIIKFRDGFNVDHEDNINPLDIANRGSAKVLEASYQQWLRLEKPGIGKVNMAGHIRASINYNESLKFYDDKKSLPITSGSKIKTVYLKKNDNNFKSMAFPAEMDELPDWFVKNFEVDMKVMEGKLIDKKLENIFSALGWAVPTKQTQFNNSIFTF